MKLSHKLAKQVIAELRSLVDTTSSERVIELFTPSIYRRKAPLEKYEEFTFCLSKPVGEMTISELRRLQCFFAAVDQIDGVRITLLVTKAIRPEDIAPADVKR